MKKVASAANTRYNGNCSSLGAYSLALRQGYVFGPTPPEQTTLMCLICGVYVPLIAVHPESINFVI